ncbi:hypothetical protein AB0M36_11180 [Actinoplanes sp. NPDC051346]|uniref:hypothetical protein n=1 Tax=Actinoplanes sp. NPDC051346 TaxID=3155048 RepID=UPI0034313954
MNALAGLAAALVLGAGAAVAPAPAVADTYAYQLLGKAAPDECFAGIGQPYPPGPPCAQGQAKVNQSYVWGMTRVGRQVWFGTGANTHCLTSGSGLADTNPVVNDDYVCEFAESQVAKEHPTVPDALGDVRVPQIWLYDAGVLTNRSAEVLAADADARRLRSTLGLRAAGTANGVVLFAGPSLSSTLNIFAFDAVTQRFLGSRTLAQYGNARTFLAAAGDLYLGAGIGPDGSFGGAVLRWRGNRIAPFLFDRVATLPAQAADLAYADGRLYATTWSTARPTTDAQLAGVWRSPALPLDGGEWTQMWQAGSYEKDPLTATTYGVGGVAAYGGWLYWGSMHVPLKATKAHQAAYPQPTEETRNAQIRFTQRAATIWRGRNLGTPEQEIELLYGESTLPVYQPATGAWTPAQTGWTARYGKSGFGNVFNNYTWRMTVAGDRLYVATMDWSYLVHLLSDTAPPTDPAGWGADLWTFPSADEAAQPVDVRGFGNYLNYGIRTMAADGDDLYLGMANPMNLRTDPADSVPEGGWELIRLMRTVS